MIAALSLAVSLAAGYYHQPQVPVSPEAKQLLAALGRTSSPEGRDLLQDNPLSMIRAANVLRPLGKDKAIEVLLELTRIRHFDAPTLSPPEMYFEFWLCHFVFQPKTSFRVPYEPGFPGDDKVLPKWPTFPTLEDDSVPLVMRIGRSFFMGSYESPIDYIPSEAKNWTVRVGQMRPPDDPFPAFERMAGDLAKLDPFYRDLKWAKQYALNDALSMVKSAWKYKGHDYTYHSSKEDFESVHREFLPAKCHWSVEKQMYVRADGSFDLDVK